MFRKISKSLTIILLFILLSSFIQNSQFESQKLEIERIALKLVKNHYSINDSNLIKNIKLIDKIISNENLSYSQSTELFWYFAKLLLHEDSENAARIGLYWNYYCGLNVEYSENMNYIIGYILMRHPQYATNILKSSCPVIQKEVVTAILWEILYWFYKEAGFAPGNEKPELNSLLVEINKWLTMPLDNKTKDVIKSLKKVILENKTN